MRWNTTAARLENEQRCRLAQVTLLPVQSGIATSTVGNQATGRRRPIHSTLIHSEKCGFCCTHRVVRTSVEPSIFQTASVNLPLQC